MGETRGAPPRVMSTEPQRESLGRLWTFSGATVMGGTRPARAFSCNEKSVESDEMELGRLEGEGEVAMSFVASLAAPLVSQRICGGVEGLEFARPRTKDGVEPLGRAIGENALGGVRLAFCVGFSAIASEHSDVDVVGEGRGISNSIAAVSVKTADAGGFGRSVTHGGALAGMGSSVKVDRVRERCS